MVFEKKEDYDDIPPMNDEIGIDNDITRIPKKRNGMTMRDVVRNRNNIQKQLITPKASDIRDPRIWSPIDSTINSLNKARKTKLRTINGRVVKTMERDIIGPKEFR